VTVTARGSVTVGLLVTRSKYGFVLEGLD
jgi:hypothetical protein